MKAVIFDFDGTLYAASHFSFSLVFAAIGDISFMKAERKVRKSLKGRDFGSQEAFWKVFFEEISKETKKPVEKIKDWYNQRYMQTMIYVLQKKYPARPLIPGLFKVLKDRGVKIVVYSDYPCVKERMKAIGLAEEAEICDKLCSVQDFGALKPAPRPFLEIAEELGLRPCDCLVVGDREDTDGEGAALSGMKFLHVISDADFYSLSETASQPF